MHKVTTINLNGRAYQLEEQGYDTLQTYLKRAESALVSDPDRAEVMSDIEQAIADKCDQALTPGKNVVSAEQISKILDQMGEVEAGEADASTVETPKSKRLFLIRESAMLMGVCQGLGAYLGIDANLVRLAFVLLTFATGGFWVVVYLIMGVILPTAKTNDELAEAYGKPMTASAIVARAKEHAPDAETMHNLGQVIARIIRIIAKIISVAAAICFALLTGVWLWALWLIVLGRLHFYEQLQFMNGWREWLAISALYLLFALPFLLVARITNRIASNKNQTRASTISESSLAVLWGLAVVTLIAFGTVYITSFQDYANRHGGRIRVGNSNICILHDICDPNNHEVKALPYPVPALPDPIQNQ